MALRWQRTTTRSLRRGAAGCCVAVALLGACGGSSSQTSSPDPSIAGSTSSSSTAEGPSSSSTTTTRDATPERAYPAGGPTDVIFPPNQPSYELITGSAGCQELLDETQKWPRETVDGVPGVDEVEGVDTVPLYQSAAYACLGRWADARTAYAQIHTSDPAFNNNTCARKALLAWLTDLVHESQADARFAPVFAASSQPSPCAETDTTGG